MGLFNSLVLTLLGFLSVTLAASHPRDFSLPAPNVFAARDECRANPAVCAEFMIGDKVNQQLDYGGCQLVRNPDQVTGIKVFDCICNLY
jgi:hypothetical protein